MYVHAESTSHIENLVRWQKASKTNQTRRRHNPVHVTRSYNVETEGAYKPSATYTIPNCIQNDTKPKRLMVDIAVQTTCSDTALQEPNMPVLCWKPKNGVNHKDAAISTISSDVLADLQSSLKENGDLANSLRNQSQKLENFSLRLISMERGFQRREFVVYSLGVIYFVVRGLFWIRKQW